MPRLGSFARAHPDITLRLNASPHRADFADDNVDVAVRYGDGHWPGLNVVRLYAQAMFPACSPSLGAILIAHGCRRIPDGIPLLHLDHRRDWGRWLETAGVVGPTDNHGPIFNQESLILNAAANGQGLALARTALVSADLWWQAA